MNRVDRLTAILTQLQSKRVVKAKEIAERFGISLRTVYRDIRALEEGGIPVIGEAGMGYSLVDGYRLPPVMFTQDEGRALVLAEKLMSQLSDKGSSQHLNSAMIKIKSVLKNNQKDELESLEHQIGVLFHHNPLGNDRNKDYLNHLLHSLSDKIIVTIIYTTFEEEKTSTRTVEPLGVYFSFGQWYLIAWCRLRKDYRNFRLDRISSLQLGTETYSQKSHPSLAEYLEKVRNTENLTEFTIEVPFEQEKYLRVQKYNMGLVMESRHKDHVEMKFMTSSSEGFVRWLLQMGDSVKLIAPESAKEMMREIVNGIRRKLD
ncbi:transcriptional regulator, putative [Indibacter alkaliphilus LW1]|jgi:predicted DNA-binding transcriptional regulator YafY|uniref:Transcriptional regulator, putative n=1 Tax=Indibacter alkaliphilus (strain CCUG 57479 / KCTC 22604 / LW1) TaxID=1189612 RepID=S2DHA2_INDAL|nr:YafY family protein [Indibacter alkaliphilus]EOZ98397.1 transcriptional regulator, putative [Indibacter alkaliphilus LW1]